MKKVDKHIFLGASLIGLSFLYLALECFSTAGQVLYIAGIVGLVALRRWI